MSDTDPKDPTTWAAAWFDGFNANRSADAVEAPERAADRMGRAEAVVEAARRALRQTPGVAWETLRAAVAAYE
jgi:hypothetical protein